MNPYDRYVLPKLIDFACGVGPVMQVRETLISQASGNVLEVGIGTGLNLRYYDVSKVKSIVGIDPAAQMQTLGRRRASTIQIPVDMVSVDVHGIAAKSSTFDTVVMTFTLCSIVEPLSALDEMYRVLKPDGRLLFAEHGLACDASISRWQTRLTPMWKRFAGGCHLDRNIPQLITQAGFQIVECEAAYLSGPKPMTYVYVGSAVPSAS